MIGHDYEKTEAANNSIDKQASHSIVGYQISLAQLHAATTVSFS